MNFIIEMNHIFSSSHAEIGKKINNKLLNLMNNSTIINTIQTDDYVNEQDKVVT